MNKYNEAVTDFTESLKDNEPDIATFTRRAASYIALGNKEAVQQDLVNALSLECKDESDHYDRATALVLSDRFDDVLVELDIAFSDLSCRVEALTDDLLDPIRGLPEFISLLKR